MRFIVFDCDGTIVNSRNTTVRLIENVWRAQGLIPPKEEEILTVTALPLEEAVRYLCPTKDKHVVEKLIQTCHEYMIDKKVAQGEQEVLFEGVVETLKTLKTKDTILAIITGKSRKGLEQILQNHNLKQFFTLTKTADCGPSKPNPTVLLEAIEEIGAEKQQTVFIGDTIYDMQMAKNAHVKSIGVSFGYHSVEALKTNGAFAIVEAFSHLPNAIYQVLQEGVQSK